MESLTKYVESSIKKRNLNKEYPFVIYDRAKRQYAGCTRLYEYSDELKIIKLGHSWIGEDFQGTKLNNNVKYLLCYFTFGKLKVERIGFGAYADNKVSIAEMKTVGCKTERYLRHLFPSYNGIRKN